MACYQIEWRQSTRKDLRRISKADISKIISTAEALAENPYPAGCVKLSGSQKSYRIRVGNYRVLYEVFDNKLVIEIIKVGHRKDVYRG